MSSGQITVSNGVMRMGKSRFPTFRFGLGRPSRVTSAGSGGNLTVVAALLTASSA